MSAAVAPLRDVARAGLPMLNNMFSPSKNPSMVLTTPLKGIRRFRYDPYAASVIESPMRAAPSPAKAPAPVAQTYAGMSYESPMPAGYAHQMVQPMYPAMSAYQMPLAPCARHPHPLVPAGMPMPPAPVSSPAPSVHVPSVRVSPCVTPVPSVMETPVVSAATSRMPSPAPAPTDCAYDDGAHAAFKREMTTSLDSTGFGSSALTSSMGSVSSAATKYYATVAFKHDTYPYIAPFRVAEGDHVIVEGDRGVNIGVVKTVSTDKPKRPVASKVIRKATTKDRETLENLRAREAAATKHVEKAVKDHGLNMAVVDTEYQFDQNKLSVFFKAKNKVDFRQLLRGLFKEFRCRVWMVNWNEVQQHA